MQQRTRQASWLGLVILTLCAFALRLYRLDGQSLWYDEGVTVEIARRGIAELTRWTAGDIQPPLYYYIIAASGRLAGWSEWSIRFPSAVFGAAAVPLLAAVTIALTRRRLAGLLAAALAAFHPLLVYYSQEARMYAMLTTLGIVLAYLVIHGEEAIRRRTLHWTAYVVVATAAVYTHYFAFFLLIALATAYLIDQLFVLPRLKSAAAPAGADADLPSTVRRRPLLGFALANVAVLLAYLPWFAALLNRLSMDASYWEGEFKLVEALRHVAISFTSGETVLEERATILLIPYALLTLVALGALLARRTVQPRTLLYALLWLAVPVAAVLLLASAVPKFNARYVMIALPGLLLLWAAGLSALVRLRAWHWTGVLRSPLTSAPSLLSGVLILLLFTGSIYAVRNWFTNPAFTKAEWRQLSAFIRSRAAERMAQKPLVVLVSGHAWPVWNYYAPDLPALRLPELEILDVGAVLDVDATAAPLAAALAGHDDAWLVQWQHEIVDPMDIVPLQLQLAGSEERLKDEFWQLKLHHYEDIRPDAMLAPPTGLSETSVNFANIVHLVDAQVAPNGDLLLFWQLHPDHPTPMPDLHITGQAFTADGLPIARISDRRLAAYAYPTFRWREGQVNLGRIPAADWAGDGALPGPYRVRLVVYDANGDLTGLDMVGEQGQPLGKHATLDIDLPAPTKGPDEMDPVTFAQLIPDLFAELSLATEQAEPGQAFAAELHWYAEEKPPADYDLLLRWRLRAGEEIFGRQIIPLTPALPTSQWPDDELLRTLHQLRPPLDLPAGDYWLEVGLTAPDSGFVRVPFRVLGSSRIFSPPTYRTPIDQVFGPTLHLLGVMEPVQTTIKSGSQTVLTLVWQALDKPDADYTATVQWLGEDSKPVAQVDLPLPGGSSNWLPEQVELQTAITAAPSTPGDYRLVLAVYDANQPNLPRVLTAQGADHFELGRITVEP
jgi:4-amino-4-deoxy-L-arabinose transferase-like glycosyltransferase